MYIASTADAYVQEYIIESEKSHFGAMRSLFIRQTSEKTPKTHKYIPSNINRNPVTVPSIP